MHIELYTDGASRGNPGPGGYGIVLKYRDKIKEMSAGYKLTTNNRMELLAVIVGLEAIKWDYMNVKVVTDSMYIVNSVNKGWLFNWEKTNFKNKKNPDLWKRFLKVYRKHHVELFWVKGHSTHPMNNRCDALATQAADGAHLLSDEVFEQEYYNK
ncbi:MAG TPA: ribonuclease HI [Chitinophagaceae bacterium]|nr:ribonuclease HI [Chitinophagaceae bacterium]